MARTEVQRQAYLGAMGIPVWERRSAVAPAPLCPSGPAVVGEVIPPGDVASVSMASPQGGSTQATVPGATASASVAALDWSALEARVAACSACELHRSRRQTVFGVGSREAAWMIIGEAPGADEDREGEPFVGRAGRLLNNMLFTLGLQREQVYIANILKCRPPGNRDPLPVETAQCEGYLARQVALVRPRLILAIGRIAAQHLLKTTVPLGKLRGQCHHYGEVPVVVTYHPAYLLRKPQDKRKSWEDLQYARRIVGEGG